MDTLVTATQLAREFGLTVRAIRFYETKGLLAPTRVGTTRVYGSRDRGRLKLILRGKRLGFSLADIREYLELYDVDTSQVGQLLLLVEKVRTRMAELEQQRTDLQAALEELADIDSQAVSALQDKGLAPDGEELTSSEQTSGGRAARASSTRE